MTGTQMDRLDYGQWRNDGVAAGPGWLRNASDYGACEGTCRKKFPISCARDRKFWTQDELNYAVAGYSAYGHIGPKTFRTRARV